MVLVIRPGCITPVLLLAAVIGWDVEGGHRDVWCRNEAMDFPATPEISKPGRTHGPFPVRLPSSRESPSNFIFVSRNARPITLSR